MDGRKGRRDALHPFDLTLATALAPLAELTGVAASDASSGMVMVI
jgi:hypothetical protein